MMVPTPPSLEMGPVRGSQDIKDRPGLGGQGVPYWMNDRGRECFLLELCSLCQEAAPSAFLPLYEQLRGEGDVSFIK